MRSYSKKLVLRVSLGFQTLENNKSTRPAASCFQMFSRVWNPNETLALVFEILLKVLITPEKRPIWSNSRYQELLNEVYMNNFE